MGKTTGISWTDHTFNPWWGCQEVSPACDHCYARRDAKRYQPQSALWGPGSTRRFFGDKHWRQPILWNAAAERAGVRRKVFCASMADVFDNALPELQRERDRLWHLIEETPHLDWQLLTKRVGNVLGMVAENWLWQDGWPTNAWVGISVVTQTEANRDIPKLARIPAPVTFLSIEPMVEQITLTQIQAGYQERCCNGRTDKECPWCGGSGVRNRPPYRWVIVGGESGPNARPMHIDWARGLRDECGHVGVPFFFKQWGEWLASDQLSPDDQYEFSRTKVGAYLDGDWHTFDPEQPPSQDVDRNLHVRAGMVHYKVGRDRAGKFLDCEHHHHFPETRR